MAPPTTTPSSTESHPTRAKRSSKRQKSIASVEVAAIQDADGASAVETGVGQLHKLLSVGRRKGFLTTEEVAVALGVSELRGDGLDEAKF
jgi:hypothetical protein